MNAHSSSNGDKHLLSHPAPVNGVSFSPNGKRVLTACENGTAYLWDVHTGVCVSRSPHPRPLKGVKFIDDGSRFITTLDQGKNENGYSKPSSNWIWETATGRRVFPTADDLFTPGKTTFQFNTEAKIIVSRDEGRVRTWDSTTGEQLGAAITTGQHASAKTNRDGSRIMVVSYSDKTLTIYENINNEKWSSLGHFDGGGHFVNGEFVAGSNRIIVAREESCAGDKQIELSLLDERCRWLGTFGKYASASAPFLSVDKKGLKLLTYYGGIGLWDISTVKALTPMMRLSDTIWATFSREGQRVLFHEGNQVHFLDSETGQQLPLVIRESQEITSAVFLGSSLNVATTCKSGWQFWHGNDGSPLLPLNQYDGYAVSENGDRIVTSGAEAAQVWELSSQRPITPPLKFACKIKCAYFDSIGSHLAVVTADNKVSLVEMPTGYHENTSGSPQHLDGSSIHIHDNTTIKLNEPVTQLERAARDGDRDEVRRLLAQCDDPNVIRNAIKLANRGKWHAVSKDLQAALDNLFAQSPPDERNVLRWEQSGYPQKWVEDHHGKWTHSDFLRLIEKLKQTDFWPMQPDAVGRVLEERKKAHLSAMNASNQSATIVSSSSEPSDVVSTELAPLLKESAHPELYHRNGFRVLEVSVEASVRDLTKRRQIVEAAAANDLPIPGGQSRILPLNPSPDAFATREAVQRLTDPERRLVDEFFWFWAHQAGASREDAALRFLSQENVAAAEQIWRKQEREQSQTLVSTHNLAILHHLRALEYSVGHLENVNGTANGAGKFDSDAERAQWEEAFQRWVVLLREEGFWSRLTTRIRELDDPRLTTGTARRIRAGLPLTLLLINAQLALKAAQIGKFDLAKSHVAIMRSSSFSNTICDNALTLATETIRTRLKSLSKTATKEANDNPEKANESTERLLEQSRPLLAIIDSLLPDNHAARGAVHDDVALAALDSVNAFAGKNKEYKKCLTLCEAMLPIPTSQSAKARLNRDYETLKEIVQHSLCWFCKDDIGEDKAAIEVKMHGDVQRIPIPGGVRKTWRHITIKVPRCKSCKSAHTRLITGRVLGGFLGGLIGLPGCVYGMNHDSPAVILPPVLLIVGAVVGNLVVKTKCSKGVGAESTKKQHPRVKELLAQGWTWGENPTQ